MREFITPMRSAREEYVELPGEVEAAFPSAQGFDSNTIIDAATARRFFNEGYQFCLRYVSRMEESANDLTAHEAIDILNSGLALMPVQHVRNPGWSPSEALGREDGENAVSNARGIGFPEGVNIWCDLEGVNNTAEETDVIAYCHAWYGAVFAAGYIPGIYVGANTLLSAEQLYALPFQHYWKSQSNVPEIPIRGYQLVQLFPGITVNGINIDRDVTQNDNEGGQAQWLRIVTSEDAIPS
jgi:hypothetical protein